MAFVKISTLNGAVQSVKVKRSIKVSNFKEVCNSEEFGQYLPQTTVCSVSSAKRLNLSPQYLLMPAVGLALPEQVPCPPKMIIILYFWWVLS